MWWFAYDKSPPVKQAQGINIKDYFSSFLKSPIHFQSQSLKHDITISSEFEPQTLGDQSISSRYFSTLGEKKMIRKKLVRFLTAPWCASPVRRFQGVLVKAVETGHTGEKDRRELSGFKRPCLSCNSYQNDNTFGKSFASGLVVFSKDPREQ